MRPLTLAASVDVAANQKAHRSTISSPGRAQPIIVRADRSGKGLADIDDVSILSGTHKRIAGKAASDGVLLEELKIFTC
jgi:hypothetical protein